MRRRSSVPLVISVLAASVSSHGDLFGQKERGRDVLHQTQASGRWRLAGGAALLVERRLFHGSDVQTLAKVVWPYRDGRAPLQYELSVAADAFAQRQPWCVWWEREAPVLWVAVGARGGRSADRWKLESLRRVDLNDPTAVSTVWLYGSFPQDADWPHWEEVNEALGQVAVLPAVGAGAVPMPQVRAAEERWSYPLVCRVRVADGAGRGAAGARVRVAAEILPLAEDRMRIGAIGGLADGDAPVLPTNLGLPNGEGVTDADGFASIVALVDPASGRGGVALRILPLPAIDSPASQGKLVVDPKQIDLTGQEVLAVMRGEQPEPGAPADAPCDGRVLDEQGDPVAGAMVLVHEVGGRARPVAAARSVRTDLDGAFRIAIPASLRSPCEWLVVRGGQTRTAPVDGLDIADPDVPLQVRLRWGAAPGQLECRRLP